MLTIGDGGKVWVNQANRSFIVQAILGDRALIEYEMPNGRDYLVEVSVNLHDEKRYSVWINRQWGKLPKAWQEAVEQGVKDLKAIHQATIAAMNERQRLDKLWASHTGFRDLRDCLNAGGNYRPSCCMADPVMVELANDYDAAQAKRGDERRAYRWGGAK